MSEEVAAWAPQSSMTPTAPAEREGNNVWQMKTTDIIGKGKDFEPPFAPDKGYDYIRDSKGNALIEIRHIENRMKHGYCEGRRILADHICELLNREHNKHQRMCLRDKSKVCNLCHDCDVDVLNPGDKYYR